jgi:hypothetical protein
MNGRLLVEFIGCDHVIERVLPLTIFPVQPATSVQLPSAYPLILSIAAQCLPPSLVIFRPNGAQGDNSFNADVIQVPSSQAWLRLNILRTLLSAVPLVTSHIQHSF